MLGLLLTALFFCAAAVEGRDVCYVDLGCFTSDAPPFYDKDDRPVDWLPDNREVLGTVFRLHTRNYIDTFQELSTYDSNTIISSDFKPWKKTKVIIHGFVNGADVDWMDDMSTELLVQDDYNIITVDWRPGSLKDVFEEAVGNSRIVGAEVALLLSMFQGIYAVGPSTFHIIGHSLGAHVAGIAGEIIPNIGRITGLDPAGPYFENTEPIIRLDSTDATFVDVIHTDTDPLYKLGMGMYAATGDVDFFPNSGREQPGCDQGVIGSIFAYGRIWGGIVQFVACNHIRAVQLYTDSINSATCPYLAFECTREWDDYNTGLCYNSTLSAQMGWLADQYAPTDGRTEVVYQHNTRGSLPFCGFQYRFHLFMDDGKKAEKAKGKIYITLIGANGQSNKIQMSPDYHFYEPLGDYMHVGVSSLNVGTVSRIDLEWEYDSAWYKPWDWEIFEDPEIFIHRIIIDSAENGESYLVCGSYEPIKPDTQRTFFKVTTCS